MPDSGVRWKDLLLLVAFAAAIHLPFHFGSVYGEEDLARLVVDALIWLKTGTQPMAVAEYRYFINPAYIWLIKELLKSSGGSTQTMSFWINTINPICAFLMVIPVYLFGAGLVGRLPALLGTLLFCMIPTVWVSGLYGFPSLLSLFLIVAALALYDLRLTRPPLGNLALHLVLVEIFIVGSVLLKADFWLSYVALFALIWLREGVHHRRLAEAAVLAAVPLLVAFCLLRNPNESLGVASHWNPHYGKLSLLVNFRFHLSVLAKGMGIVSVPLFFIALAVLGLRRKYSYLFFFACWPFLIMGYWFLQPTDDARHHLPEAVPIAFAIGWLLTQVPGRRYLPWAGLLAILAINYLAFPPSSSTRIPSGRVLESARLIQERNAAYHRLAKEYEAVRVPRKVILGTFTNPYVDAEVLSRATSVSAVRRREWLGHDAIEIDYVANGQPCVSASVRVLGKNSPDAASAYHHAGFAVYSMEYDFHRGELTDPERLNKLVGY